MGKSLARALISAVIFAYGSFTVILYSLIALAKGTYFNCPTEDEKRDLQLGELCVHQCEGLFLLTIQLAIVCGIYLKTSKVSLTTF